MRKIKYHIQDDFLPVFVSHPGKILREELLERNLSQQGFSDTIKRPLKTVSLIINGKKSITADTAYDFEKALGISADFWLGMQNDYDLYVCRQKRNQKKAKTGGAEVGSIAILGYANCGEALSFAEENEIGRIRYPVHKKDAKKIFALKAVGDSMNKAVINGKNIEDGDIVIVRGKSKEPENGDCVLSIINGKANIKKFFKDEKNKQVILFSESSDKIDPIYITEKDNEDFSIAGIVIDVVKA